MSEIDLMLRRQAALAGRIMPDGQTRMTLAGAGAAVPAYEREQAENEAEMESDPAGAAGDERQTRRPLGALREKQAGAGLLLRAFLELTQQNAAAGMLYQQAREQQTADIRRRQSVQLSSRTPQNTPAGLTGGYEQTLTVAGPAAAPTSRSMAEISRFFERDARRYG